MAHIKRLSDETSERVLATYIYASPGLVLEALLSNAVAANANEISLIALPPYTSLLVTDNGVGLGLNDLLRIGKKPVEGSSDTTKGAKSLFLLSLIAKICIRSTSPVTHLTKSKTISFGEHGPIKDVHAEDGAITTTVSVERLFENLPVRQKLLSFDNSPLQRAITQLTTSFAVCHPHISFTFTLAEATLHLSPQKRLLSRLGQIFPHFALPALHWIPIHLTTHSLSVHGLLLSPLTPFMPTTLRQSPKRLLFHSKKIFSYPQLTTIIDTLWFQFSAPHHDRKPVPYYCLEIDGLVEAYRSLDGTSLLARPNDAKSLQSILHEYLYELLSETCRKTDQGKVKDDQDLNLNLEPSLECVNHSNQFKWIEDVSEDSRSVVEVWKARHERLNLKRSEGWKLSECGPRRHWHPEISSLKNGIVVGQLDKKVILVLTEKGALYGYDQHGLHERIRFEALLAKLQSLSPDILSSVKILPFVIDEISFTHYLLLKTMTKTLLDWKWEFLLLPHPTASDALLVSGEKCQVIVTSVPSVCGVALPAKAILTHLESASAHDASVPSLPSDMIDIVKSKACRGAIMFGDVLTLETSQVMLTQLQACVQPFVCAHGRPNVAVLLEGKVNVSAK